MTEYEVLYISTNRIDELGYPQTICVQKRGADATREYKPRDVAFIQKTHGGQVRCSHCQRQLKREYLTGFGFGWNYCPQCGAAILGIEGMPEY